LGNTTVQTGSNGGNGQLVVHRMYSESPTGTVARSLKTCSLVHMEPYILPIEFLEALSPEDYKAVQHSTNEICRLIAENPQFAIDEEVETILLGSL
jgi:hypothetical protein